MSKNAQQEAEHIFDELYTGYGINIKPLISMVGRLLYYFQCADRHNLALSSR